MARTKKPTPLEAFDEAMADAHHLIQLAESLTNTRVRRMRKELRARVGEALRVPAKDRGLLDCLESADVFLVFYAGSNLSRTSFRDHRPLLRQAIVAACAATETYVADRVMASVGNLTKSSASLTPRLAKVPLTVHDWISYEEQYTRRRWGIRKAIETHVREHASTAPNKIGELLSLAGISDWATTVDRHRKAKKGDTVSLLKQATERRNRIAHAGDRSGQGRADLTVAAAKEIVGGLESVVHAMDASL